MGDKRYCIESLTLKLLMGKILMSRGGPGGGGVIEGMQDIDGIAQ